VIRTCKQKKLSSNQISNKKKSIHVASEGEGEENKKKTRLSGSISTILQMNM
jgi:hypothetical protein